MNFHAFILSLGNVGYEFVKSTISKCEFLRLYYIFARVAVNLSLQIDIFLVLGCIKFEKITKLFQKIGGKIHQQIVH